jgi:hypothetical protein
MFQLGKFLRQVWHSKIKKEPSLMLNIMLLTHKLKL